VAPTFVVLGIGYALFMTAGALVFRAPPPGWRPAGWTPPPPSPLISRHSVHPDQAIKTRQFWLLWIVLCFNVTAGIGVLGQASAMIQEVFKGAVTAAAAAGFVGLLSLFNMGGRFFWSSLSDKIGRKRTYACFFGLGMALYAAVPAAGAVGSVVLFVACFAVILTMFGGGFATIPAYLSDLFGTRFVGAIHGRLLTAWSTAGLLGPALVNYIRQYQVGRGVPATQAYNATMLVMVALLAVGFVANWLVSPVDARYHLPDLEPARAAEVGPSAAAAPTTSLVPLAAAWGTVALPLGWGVAMTLGKALALFR
jgi:MFS family permease